MDNMDFIAQLAQFGQLEATTNLGDYLASMESFMASINNFGAADLVGKEIKAIGDKVEISGSDPVTLNYDLKGNAATLDLNIYSSDDLLVKSISVGPTEAGDHQLVWNGTDNSGSPVSPGTYTFEVNAKDKTDTAVDVTTFIDGVVDKAVFVSGIPYLHIGSQEVPLKNVLEIREFNSS
jgi:flagellar basal-body rod modification protein FlgD